MSEKMQKHNWLVNWNSARDKERAACVSCDWETARFWARVALGIEMGFTAHFGQEFGEFLSDFLG